MQMEWGTHSTHTWQGLSTYTSAPIMLLEPHNCPGTLSPYPLERPLPRCLSSGASLHTIFPASPLTAPFPSVSTDWWQTSLVVYSVPGFHSSLLKPDPLVAKSLHVIEFLPVQAEYLVRCPSSDHHSPFFFCEYRWEI
jgi:hypothetical protein